MSSPLRVLLLEDQEADARLVVQELRRAGFEPAWERVDDEATFLARLDPLPDVILCDYSMPQFDALRALALLRARGLDLPLIIVSGSIGEDIAVAALKDGAADYLLKDRLGRLGEAVKQALEQRRLRAERRAAEQQLRQVLASSPAIIYSLRITGEASVPAWVSDNVRVLMGYDPQDALSVSWWIERLHPEDRAAVMARWPVFLKDGQLAIDYRFRHKDETYRWVRDEKRLIRDGDGRPAECVGSWSDVTELKQLEEQLRQSQKMEAIGRLAGGVAHDFNNLLTVISGYSEMLLAGLHAGDPLHDGLTEIQKASRRAGDLTRQLLAFGRRQILLPVILDLNNLLTNMERMLRRLIGEDVELRVSPGAGLWLVKADPGQLEQVVMNLVINARDAMPTGGKLTIETQNVHLNAAYAELHAEAVAGDHVLLAVTDTGHGMEPAVQARIFEPFFTTKEAGKGTGLGLSTVHGIVKQSGGRIEVYSEPGHGTTFKVYLPREARPTPARKSAPGAGRPYRGTETVLLVEDEDGVRSLTRTVLEMCGYVVLEAASGGEAGVLAEQHPGPIHLLVSDVVMPRMSGPQLAERLASQRPTMRVLYLSGYTNDAIHHHGILDSDAPFLQKPFGPDALARKVREVLDETPSA